MEYIIIAFAGAIFLFCFIMIILTCLEIHKMSATLEKIIQAKTNQKVTLSSPNRLLESLARQINRLLEQKQELEIRYKNMDLQQRQAIANISHDLRTPLTSVIGYIQFLQDEALPVEKRRQYTDIVLGRARSLQALISDFFDLSKCEAGEYKLNLEPIKLQDILCGLMASFYNDFADRGIEPEISIDEAALAIFADETAIKRIYSNLVQNALKHGSGGMIVSLKQESGCVVSCLTNHAPELTETDVQHLFERFFTADRMRSGRNTGLGLAITKALVEQMGGVITASLSDAKLSIVISWRNI